jgi:hypothetical protein
VNVDVFQGHHHAFVVKKDGNGPKVRKANASSVVPEGAELIEKGDNLVYTSARRSVEFPKDTFDEFADSFAGVVGEKRSAVAGYTVVSGFRFPIAGWEGKGGKPSWERNVWAAGRQVLRGQGYHWVELAEKDGTVYVFGAESHGMYLEAFDLATGKCRFRFRSCYWFNFSETWDLK